MKTTAESGSIFSERQQSTSSLCDPKTKYPRINPLLERLALPLSATLATFFGAAIGLGKARTRLKFRISAVFRWGALIGTEDDRLAVIQTLAGFVYLAGLTIAFGYLFFDSQNQAGVADSPFTHTFIKSQGNAFFGIVLAGFALALGVEPPPPTNGMKHRNPEDYREQT